MRRFAYCLFLLCMLGGFFKALECHAQDFRPAAGWDSEKIRGTLFKSYGYYDGNPFFTKEWKLGSVQLSGGENIDSLNLKYSSYKDELIYYNTVAGAQVQIDKRAISSFWSPDDSGHECFFRKQYYDRYPHGDRFFQVLYDGNIDFVCSRKVDLISCSPYYGENGILKNQIYVLSPSFFFYSPEKGYCPVRPTKRSLLLQFSNDKKKEVRRLLRKQHEAVVDEYSFATVWAVLDKAGFVPEFRRE